MSGKNHGKNGRSASTRTGKRSASEAASKGTKLSRLLASIYDRYQKLDDAATNKVCRRDFVFHMSDWEEALRDLAELYEHPERFSRTDAEQIVAGFLYHATPHIMEAARLMLDYEPGYIFDSPKPTR
jgi:hypothetical protein